MKPYEQLDAWQVCQALTVTSWKATDTILATEPQLANRLRYVTMRATGRIAFGAATGHGRMFRTAIIRADGYLGEAGYVLELLHTRQCLAEETWRELEGLRGRASFYVSKLLMEQIRPPDLTEEMLEEFDWDEREDWQK
jgi:hypothetical protein